MERKATSGIILTLLIFSLLAANMIIVTAQETHDIAVVSVTPSSTLVEKGNVVNISVVVENQGTESETFNVTTYRDNTAIDTKTVENLGAGANTSLTVAWSTAGFWDHTSPQKIKAVASTVLGEIDTEDNTLTSSSRIRVFDPPYVAVVPHTTVNPNLTIDTNYTVSIYTDYNGSDITAYQFSLTWNPNILEGIEVTNGDIIKNATHPDKIEFAPGPFDNTDGELITTYAYFVDAGDVASGPGKLANVTFNVVGLGDSDIVLGDDTKLIGWNSTAGETYTIIDQYRPHFFHILHGFFQNKEVTHDVAVVSVTVFPTEVVQGEPVTITVVIENQGTVVEDVTVKIYYDYDPAVSVPIEERTVSGLTVGENTTVNFTWDTTHVRIATHTITAIVSRLLGETDTDDNTLRSDETVTVLLDAVYIRPNGSIDPSTAPISTVDNVTYTFTDNIYDEIVVERDNIIVDGAGYTVQGTGDGAGIDLSGRNDVTIKNIEIKGFGYGIFLYQSPNNTISGNNITNNIFGVRLLWASHNIVSENNITGNGFVGIELSSSHSNNLYENTINVTGYVDAPRDVWGGGIDLIDSSNNKLHGNTVTARDSGGISFSNFYYKPGVSSNNTLRNNTMTGSRFNFGFPDNMFFVKNLSDFVQDIDTSNTVDGRPVYYWVNRHDATVPLDAGYVALINCTNIGVKNLNLRNNWEGILLAYTKDSSITQNSITNNNNGIELGNSSNNLLSGNNLYMHAGMYVDRGIGLSTSSNNKLYGNNVTGGTIYLIDSSSYNNIYDNTVTDSRRGILLFFSLNNNIYENTVTNCSDAIWLAMSSNNVIYHNSFINNTEQVTGYGSINVWDDGYPSGGNYWSNYTGVDADNDGIGDTPHVIDTSNQDNYPLIEPWSKPTMTKTLIRTVKFWNLSKGTENSLTSKLEGAIHHLDMEKENGAAHKLMTFINKVETSGLRKLTSNQADYLTTEAQRIIDIING